jgi:hypothetical protein
MPHLPDQGLRRGEVSEGVQQRVIALAQSCALREKQAEFCPILSRMGCKSGQSVTGRMVWRDTARPNGESTLNLMRGLGRL